MSALPGLRARRLRWALLALAALLLRALIPVGFMPAATAEGFGLELCADAAPLAPAAHHHHHHGSRRAAPCPYAASATLACATAEAAAPAVSAIAGSPGDAAAPARAFVPSILRAQSPRAPPVLAR